MTRYLQIIQRHAGRLDAIGISGIGLAVFALALFVSAVQPAHDEIDRLQAKLARAGGGRTVDRSAGSDAASSMALVDNFTRTFPSLSAAPGWILKMHEIAAHHGLTLDSGEYRLLKGTGADKEGGAMRYQITLPLRGGYAQVREFLAQVLQDVPAATLDEVTIKRDNVGARTTETRVRLVMYLAGEK